MREIIINNQTFEVRGLKRKEVKSLKKDGVNLMDLDINQADDVMDRVFDLVLTKDQIAVIDEMENKHALSLWVGILKETFGSGDEEKNLPGSGNTSQTKSE